MIKNILKITSLIFTSSLLFTACVDENSNNAMSNGNLTIISGTVVDGPVYDANVSVYNLDGKYLGSTVTSSVNGKLGDYNLSINNLPSEYIIKVTGGKDSGLDGLKDTRDKNSFDMSSRGETSLDKNITTLYISPATTVISNMIKDNNLTYAQANNKMIKSLGLPTGFDLSTTNPKTNDIASRAGTFVAQILNTIPSDNKEILLKVIANNFNNSADNNKSVISITSTNVDVLDLNLTQITKNVQGIDQNSINKIQKGSKLLNKTIKQALLKTKAIDTQTENERKEAISSNKVLEQLSLHIQKEDMDTFDINKLESFSIKLENIFDEILKDNIHNLSSTNIQIVSSVVKNNLDKNISVISSSIKQIAHSTKDIDKTTVNIYAIIYSNLDINQSYKVSNINQSDILSLYGDMKDEDNSTKALLEQIVAMRLSIYIKDSNATIKSDEIESVRNDIIKNDLLKEKLANVALNQNSNDNYKRKSATLTFESINKNIQNEDFIYNIQTQQVSDNLEQITLDKLQAVLGDGTKTLSEKFSIIKAIELNTKLTDLNEYFDSDKYDSSLNTLNNISKELSDKLKVDNTINLDTSYNNIEKKLEQNLENNISIADSYTQISDNLDSYIIKKENKIIYLDNFSFPKLGAFKMPLLIKLKVN